jgi:hypothetical protein
LHGEGGDGSARLGPFRLEEAEVARPVLAHSSANVHCGTLRAAVPTHKLRAARRGLPHQLILHLQLMRMRGGLPAAAPLALVA